MVEEKDVRVEIENFLARITIIRPEKRGALDQELIDTLCDRLGEVDRSFARVAVLTGAGSRSFCAGFDLDEFDPDQPLDSPLPDERFEKAVRAVENLDAVTIAQINGDAFGGGLDLALACDFRVAVSSARFAMPPCRIGLVYKSSGIERFVAKLGAAATRRLFLLAQAITADQALAMGIVDDVAPASRIDETVRELAEIIARNAPLALRGTRRAIQAAEARRTRELEPSLELLRREAFSSRDLRRGLEALKKKTAPTFQGD